ncbi:hypothetical protein PG999_010848 [Apiospora kogelbergensis]|uniref:2EXR domain-containing protein n=1 Tax=Apiospora kogelbergensis TaxID=1337665 RepID=A0AAW0QMG4_9PEZI
MVSSAAAEFHPYSSLPLELRREIWLHFLEEERKTSHVYTFHFRYPKRNLVATTESRRQPPRPEDFHDHYQARPGDRAILQPFLWRKDTETGGLTPHLLPLKTATAAWRTAAATCAESREMVLDVLPDVLTFQVLPYSWACKELPEDRSDGSNFPSYDLRFNGAEDVVLFHAGWTDLEAIVRVAGMSEIGGGGPHPSFESIRHIGLSGQGLLRGFQSSHGEFERCYRNRECLCDDPSACPPDDACRLEPLPAFLALFPQLRTLYLAHARPTQISPGKLKSAMPSHCPPRAAAPPDAEVFGTGWYSTTGDYTGPVFRAVDFLRQSLVGYAADDGGRFMPSSRIPGDRMILEMRESWRRVFPYYKSLQHLDIRFMAQLEPKS